MTSNKKLAFISILTWKYSLLVHYGNDLLQLTLLENTISDNENNFSTILANNSDTL